MDNELKYFGMLIPTEGIKINEMVEDSRGAPIYAPCPANGGLCACTGACQVVIEYSKDPVKLSEYRRRIKNYNEFRKSIRERYSNWRP